ncbi:MAG: hypothetical protein ABSB35_20640 [Bryobacteraceae bacterium]
MTRTFCPLNSTQFSPQPLSRGEYGPRVGVPGILKMLDRYGVPAPFLIPAMSAKLHQDADEERMLTKRAFDFWTEGLARKPAGIRTPSWFTGRNTFDHS